MLPASTAWRFGVLCILVVLSGVTIGQDEYLHLRYNGAEGSEYHVLETVQKLTYSPSELIVHFTDGTVQEIPLENLRYYNYETPSTVEESAMSTASVDLSAYPNPTNGVVRLSYELPAAAQVRLCMYDASGREAEILDEGFRTIGPYELVWDTRTHSPGMYFCQLVVENQIITQRIIVTP